MELSDLFSKVIINDNLPEDSWFMATERSIATDEGAVITREMMEDWFERIKREAFRQERLPWLK
jgi:hypothetical protein